MSTTERYYCKHCGRHFEAEPRDGLECPSCFWSSSVVLEEEAEAGSLFSGAAKTAAAKEGPKNALSAGLKKGLLGAVVVMLAAGAGFAGFSMFRQMAGNLQKALPEKISYGQRVPVPELPEGAAEKETLFSEVEKEILYRQAKLLTDRPLTLEEQNTLAKEVSFRTGKVEKLPSPSWTLENFKRMLDDQQRFYQIPLPRSYRKRLEEKFRTDYDAASEAFARGEIKEARDSWVSFLALPVYGDNLQKHRGVVLTMLRGLINDTISKIGALNHALIEDQVRAKEMEISGLYQKVLQALRGHSWEEALGLIRELEARMAALESAQGREHSIPPYPPIVAQVDEGIQRALGDITGSAGVAIADIHALREDLAAKKSVAVGFTARVLEENRVLYESAMEKIRAGEWSEARSFLSSITHPPELLRDARDKLGVLAKINRRNLDSLGQTR